MCAARHEDDARLVVASVVEHLADEARALPDVLVYNGASYNLRGRGKCEHAEGGSVCDRKEEKMHGAQKVDVLISQA